MKYYYLAHNLDRDETDVMFVDGQPAVYSVIKMEDELIWHYPEGVYARGVGGTTRDRHFEGCDAVIVGMAEPMMEELFQ